MSDFVQSSMAVNPGHYGEERMVVPRRGIILDVKYPDDPTNRSARESVDFRGYLATATVFVVDVYSILPNVLIPPGNMAHGLDGFEEWYPRGSSKLVTGEEFSSSMAQIDPYDLDGDWCIIQWLNGQIDSPYVARWWPNPRNIYDTLTTGKAYPPQNGSSGTALDQTGRYFRRINGVEQVIDRDGNIWFSTYRSGSQLCPGGTVDGGRFPRMNKDAGGNIKVQVKPSKVVEVSWDEQVDGVGSDDTFNPSLPQTNPADPEPSPVEREKTYLRIDQEKFELEVPFTLEVRSSDKLTLTATNLVEIDTDTITIKAPSEATIESDAVRVGKSTASEAMVLGDALKAWLETHTHPTGTGPSGAPLEAITLVDVLSTKHKIDE